MVRGGARGRGRGAGASAGALPGPARRRAAVLFGMAPGRETMVMDAEAVMALMDVVYCGQVGYLVRWDGWFGHR